MFPDLYLHSVFSFVLETHIGAQQQFQLSSFANQGPCGGHLCGRCDLTPTVTSGNLVTE